MLKNNIDFSEAMLYNKNISEVMLSKKNGGILDEINGCMSG